MTTYLLDTSIFSALMKEHRKVHDKVVALRPEDRLTICATVRGEIAYGIQRQPEGRKRSDLEAKANRYLDAVLCEDVTCALADNYGYIKRKAESVGKPLDENDLWIAATALHLKAVVVAQDTDFQRLGDLVGLKVENWAE